MKVFESDREAVVAGAGRVRAAVSGADLLRFDRHNCSLICRLITVHQRQSTVKSPAVITDFNR